MLSIFLGPSDCNDLSPSMEKGIYLFGSKCDIKSFPEFLREKSLGFANELTHSNMSLYYVLHVVLGIEDKKKWNEISTFKELVFWKLNNKTRIGCTMLGG